MTGKQKAEAVQAAGGQLAAGKLAQAEALCRAVLGEDSRYGEAWFTLGWVQHRAREEEAAVESFEKAIECKRSEARYYNGKGVALSAGGRLDEAEASFRKAIDLQGGYAEAHGNLAKVFWLQGRLEEAEGAYHTAVKLGPSLAEAHNNLGTFLRSQKRYDEALAEHFRAVELNPKLAQGFYNVGVDFARQQHYENAIGALHKALELKSEYAAAYAVLGYSLAQMTRYEEAVPCLERVLREHPRHLPTKFLLADTLERARRLDRAITEFGELVEMAPRWEEAELRLAVLTGRAVLIKLPADTVAKLFDDYADRFDEHLTGVLEYQAPQLLHAAISGLVQGRKLDIIDLGCGTGLAGVLLKPMAKTLTGVDLSRRMIEHAQSRGIYDHLMVAELTAALQQYSAAFDLVIAADVLIYLGSLAEVFAASAAAMRPGGLFAFTVEAADGDGFVLSPTTYRYAHSLPYVRKLAGAQGFTEEFAKPAALRKESSNVVRGYVIILRKAG